MGHQKRPPHIQVLNVGYDYGLGLKFVALKSEHSSEARALVDFNFNTQYIEQSWVEVWRPEGYDCWETLSK